MCMLTVLLCSFKILPLIKHLIINNRISGTSYTEAIHGANTFGIFLERLSLPINRGPGTMYLGIMPILVMLIGAAVFFKKMVHFIIILILFVFLSFGPNIIPDLHKFLWHMPIFKSMEEISKYYAVIIVFVIAILAGKLFSAFRHRKRIFFSRVLPLFILLYSYTDLLNSNIGYFNVFREKFNYSLHKKELFHIKVLNVHRGNETVIIPLLVFLYKKNIGLLNTPSDFERETRVIPRYLLLPKYALLMPSTALLVFPNPEYKAEAFFLNKDNSVKVIDISPNNILVNARINTPKDILVINQNFDKFWRSEKGIIENYNGLISVRLNSADSGDIRLVYFHKLFLLGLCISFTSFILCIYLLKKLS